MVITPDNYTADDFKEAVSALLPPGEYWQYESGDSLDKLLSALGREFKTTHDETQLNILFQPDNADAGWRIADYQTILTINQITGTVYDDSAAPNLIYIDVESGQTAGNLMRLLDDYRLPHTAFCWTLNNKQTLHIGVARQSLQINRTIMRAV